ncbi:MAG: hypothetical protein SGPRY_007857, partial [Prymnesium sp.]
VIPMIRRLVIIVTELTSSKERQLTPETHPDLPVRMAVRMSMGVPGLMEPVRYNGHLYCDGGMTNDFPMHVLPKRGRIGLMVKPKQWVHYHMGQLEQIVGKAELERAPAVKQSFSVPDAVYPVRTLTQPFPPSTTSTLAHTSSATVAPTLTQ